MSSDDPHLPNDDSEGEGPDGRAVDEAEEESFPASDPPSQFRFD